MKGKKSLLAISFFAIVGLVLASCAPAPAPPATPKPAVPAAKPATPAATQAPLAKPIAPTPTAKPGAEAPRYGGTLTVPIMGLAPHFDMISETGGAVQLPLATCYNLLMKHDPLKDFQIAGDLAASWEISADGLTYTFHLNEGVKFHNGRPLSAEDVRFNFDRIINPPKGTLSVQKELYGNVNKIEAVDVRTLKITLKEPQASFLTLAALPFNFIFDPEVIKQKGDMKRDVLGTGPFKLQSFVDGVSFTAQKNPDYFVKGRPYLDKVIFYTIRDERTRSAAMRTRQVLVVPVYGAVSTSLYMQMQKAEPSIVLKKLITPAPNPLIPNLKVAPWSDVRVRRAVNLAIDRDAASKAVRDFYPGYDYLLPGSPWELPKEELVAMPGNRQPKDQDIAEAKRLLAEAGYPEGFETPLLAMTVVYTKEVAEVAQAQLAKIGLKLNLQFLDSAAWKNALYQGSFRFATHTGAVGLEDPDILLGGAYLTGSPGNFGGWSNRKFDELYALQSRTMDPSKRKETLWEISRLLHQEVPRINVVWCTFYAASWPEVRNWFQGRSLYLGNSPQDVWLAK